VVRRDSRDRPRAHLHAAAYIAVAARHQASRSPIPLTQDHRAEFPGRASWTCERRLAAGLVFGPGFGWCWAACLMARFGWRLFFFVLGLASLLWLGPWLKWMPKNQAATQTIGGRAEPARVPETPIGLGTSIGLFCCNYVNYFLITWSPFTWCASGISPWTTWRRSAYPLTCWGGGLFRHVGRLAFDRWILSGATPSRVRKTFTGGGLAFAGVFVGLAAVSGRSTVLPRSYSA